MTEDELKIRLQRELPALLREDAAFRAWLEQVIRDTAVPRTAFDERFDRFLAEAAAAREREDAKWARQDAEWEAQKRENHAIWAEIKAAREREDAKWEKQTQENHAIWAEIKAAREREDAKWEKQTQENHAIWAEIKAAREREDAKWEAQRQKDERIFAELEASRRRQDQQFGAMGARWGIASEQSFRDALKGILEQSFGVEVLNTNEYDDEGLVFGRPDQVEIDIIINNGAVILCELKSSMSKGDMYVFDRKVQFYERRHQRAVQRRIVVSPMVHPSARPVAEKLGIEVFAYAEDTTGLKEP